MLGSNGFQVMENGETYTVLSPCTNPSTPPRSLITSPQSEDCFQPQENENFPCTSSPNSGSTIISSHESGSCDNNNAKPADEVEFFPLSNQCEKVDKMSDFMSKLSPALLETIQESPQKRRRESPEQNEFDISFKRRRNSSFISFETPGKRKFKDILKTPVNLFNRRKSLAVGSHPVPSATVTSSDDKKSLNETITSFEMMETASLFNQSSESVQTATSSNTPLVNKSEVNCKITQEVDTSKSDKSHFKSPSVLNVFTTPKNRNFFKKGFRKSFMSDTKSNLKHISEHDPNCSVDDMDISICESVRTTPGLFLHPEECTPFSRPRPIPSSCDDAGPDSCGLSTSSVRVLTLTIIHYNFYRKRCLKYPKICGIV